MVDHDRALNIAISGLKAINLALEADTSSHEEDAPSKEVWAIRLVSIAAARKLLNSIGNKINIIDGYNYEPDDE